MKVFSLVLLSCVIIDHHFHGKFENTVRGEPRTVKWELFVVNVAGNPLVHLGGDPEAVDAAGDQRQESPLQPVAEQGTAGTNKAQSSAVNDSVANHELQDVADGPRSSNAAGDGHQQAGDNGVADGLEDAAIPSGVVQDSRNGNALCSGSRRSCRGCRGNGVLLGAAVVAELHFVRQLVAAVVAEFHIYLSFPKKHLSSDKICQNHTIFIQRLSIPLHKLK